MDRSNHYEAAFEAYLRAERLGYVAVDEARRTELDDEPIKSLDFIVCARDARLLVDVKGRLFPSRPTGRRRLVWENWCEREDLDGLTRWEQRFGAGCLGLLVFVYHVLPVVDLPLGTADQWFWRDRRYLMRAVPAHDYRRAMRVRSPRWDTVHLPHATFRQLVRPFRDFLSVELVAAAMQASG
jgi:hypothetical protein